MDKQPLKNRNEKIKCLESIPFCPKTNYLYPSSSFFHFFYTVGAQKLDIKHSTFIASGLEELGDLEVYNLLCLRSKNFRSFLYMMMFILRKICRIRSFSGPYFPVFGLNISLRISPYSV